MATWPMNKVTESYHLNTHTHPLFIALRPFLLVFHRLRLQQKQWKPTNLQNVYHNIACFIVMTVLSSHFCSSYFHSFLFHMFLYIDKM